MKQGGARPGSGRPAGSPNKRTQEIQERLAQLECDPIEGMAMIANDPSLDQSIRLQAFKELAQYVAPKRKAIDMAATVDGTMKIEVVRFGDVTDDEDTDSE